MEIYAPSRATFKKVVYSIYLREEVVAAGDEQTVSSIAAPPVEGHRGDDDTVAPDQAQDHECLP